MAEPDPKETGRGVSARLQNALLTLLILIVAGLLMAQLALNALAAVGP